jgi:23S rRNA (pseudouridine1915-N3)-methyltransferase
VKISIICMGRTRERFIQDGIEKYLRYLKHYAPAVLNVLREEKVADLRDAPRIRKLEAAKITKTISPGAYVVALDERGREFTSHEFAAFMDKALEKGIREMSFVLGGAMGLDESVTGMADTVLALSRWTLTHEMARLVLLEQLYRAFTIIKGKTYHY